MQIISQGNDYIVQFDLYSDLTNIAKNVTGNLTYNNTQLTLVSMTVTPAIGIQSTLNSNMYLFGTVLPKKHYSVACVFTVLQESPLIPITWSVSTSNPETSLTNNTKTINLVDYLDGLLASDICSNLQGCVVSARVRFLQVLPSGEWLWENYNPVGNIQLSTFTTPATSAQTITSTDSSVTVTGSDLSVTHTLNPDGSITLNDGTVIPAPATVVPETITTLVNNNNGTATYTNETGTTITFPIGGATLVDNGNGTITYTSENGTVTTFDKGFTSFVNSANGFTATYPNGSTYVWSETITALVAATDGFSYTSENGTVTTVTYLFDNATPASPSLLVQVNGITQASIPLNSYDVNISTSGGFAFNPTTDQITITETDGETHVIDLTPLRTTLTSVDASVEIVPSVNPDGSTNYDLGVKAFGYEVNSNPFTGVEVPVNPGVNIGDTKSVYFSSGETVHYTWDGSNWILDFSEDNVELRFCLNNVGGFSPLDPNNPTTAEVETWKNANLNLAQQTSGTILTYYVVGDGGSCDVPDFTWTLNKGSELITLVSKRVFNTKTVYVDAGSGSDVTGRRGYREFPFKTLNAGITAALEGDLLHVFPGNYTQNTPITRWINIHCENGVDWLLQSAFSVTTDFALAKTVSWKFDVIRQITYNQYGFFITNTLGGYNLTANLIEKIQLYAYTKERYVKINKSKNSTLGVQSLGASNPQGTNEIESVEWDYTQGSLIPLFTSENSNVAQINLYCKNLRAVNSLVGGNNPTIGYFYGSDTGTDKNIKTKIDNISFTDPNIYATPAGPLAGSLAWRNTTPGTHAGMLATISSAMRNNSVFEFDFGNVKSSGHGFFIAGTSNFDNGYLKVKITGLFSKGVPAWTSQLANVTNSTIIFDLDLIADTAMGLFIGFGDGVNIFNNIHPSNQIIVTGRIKTRQAGYPCISIGQGTAASNNTNGTILLKDLTLINDGTVSPIMCAVQENVQIQNVTSNSLVSDPNILEIGESIVRNISYK